MKFNCKDGRCERSYTPRSLGALRETLEKLGWPERVTKSAILDIRNTHTDGGGHEWFVRQGIDISCDCLCNTAMRECGYTGGPCDYIKEPI